MPVHPACVLPLPKCLTIHRGESTSHQLLLSFLYSVRPTNPTQGTSRATDSSRSKPQPGWRTEKDPSLWVRGAEEIKTPQLSWGHLTHFFSVLLPGFLGYRGSGLELGAHMKGYFDIRSWKGVRKEGGWVFLDAA